MDRETIIGGAWANAAQPHTHTQWLDACCRKSHHSKLNLGPPPLKKRTTAHSDVVYGRKEYGSHPGWTLAAGYTPVCSWCHDFDLRTCLMFTVLQKKKTAQNGLSFLSTAFITSFQEQCFHWNKSRPSSCINIFVTFTCYSLKDGWFDNTF